jgi:hypothetical protein
MAAVKAAKTDFYSSAAKTFLKLRPVLKCFLKSSKRGKFPEQARDFEFSSPASPKAPEARD